MIHIHWSTLAAIAVALVTLFIAYREGSSGGGGYSSIAPLVGCAVFLLGMVVMLLIFLVRAWGWI